MDTRLIFSALAGVVFAAVVVATITTIPMIRLFLPPKQLEASYKTDNGISRFDIREATNQTVWLNEKGQHVPKQQKIIFTRDIMIFHISRRVQRTVSSSFASPYQFSQLPMTITGFDSINTFPVSINPVLALEMSSDQYELRSVVAILQSTIQTASTAPAEIAIGSCALLMRHRNIYLGFDNDYFIYDPYGASIPVANKGFSKPEEQYITNKPISRISQFNQERPGLDAQTLGFMERAENYGTLFVYYKKTLETFGPI